MVDLTLIKPRSRRAFFKRLKPLWLGLAVVTVLLTCALFWPTSPRDLGVGDRLLTSQVLPLWRDGDLIVLVRHEERCDRSTNPCLGPVEGLTINGSQQAENLGKAFAALGMAGSIFQSTMDSEVFIHLIAISQFSTVVDRLIDALKQVIGAYSLIALTNEALIGARDPMGVRPLILGHLQNAEGGDAWVLASETCALDIVGADFIRDVEPGEIVVINDGSKDGTLAVLQRCKICPRSKAAITSSRQMAWPSD